MRLASSPTVRRLAAAALLIAAGWLTAVRALGLAADPRRPTAERERRFLAWAWRQPEVRGIFDRIEAELAPGEPVLLVVAPAARHHAQWWRFMATYHLPRHRILGVRVAHPGTVPAGDGAVVHFPARGEPTVRRHGAVPRDRR